MKKISENSRILKQIKTKPLEGKVRKGTKIFGDVKSREQCKSDVLTLKSEGYSYAEIGEYFKIDKQTIINYMTEIRKEVKQEFLENRTDVLTDFFYTLKRELQDVREEMYTSDVKMRVKYRDLIRKYLVDQADILGLKIIKIENTNTEAVDVVADKFLERLLTGK